MSDYRYARITRPAEFADTCSDYVCWWRDNSAQEDKPPSWIKFLAYLPRNFYMSGVAHRTRERIEISGGDIRELWLYVFDIGGAHFGLTDHAIEDEVSLPFFIDVLPPFSGAYLIRFKHQTTVWECDDGEAVGNLAFSPVSLEGSGEGAEEVLDSDAPAT